MNSRSWIEHLASWKMFLMERLSETADDGERIKIGRQLQTIERVRCGAVLNPELLVEFITPTERKTTRESCDRFVLDINESQQKAVEAALSDNTLTLIQGPPGTGKTQVIAEICLQLYRRNPGIRILICSETHVAVNNLIHRIAKQNDQIRIVRIRDKENDDSIDEFSPEVLINDYIKWASVFIENKDAFNIIADGLKDCTDRSLEKALALSANVVGMTCNRTAAYDFRDTTEMFDVVIIDEVCKATLPEILAPMIIARKAVLLGDPKQLPPVFCSDERKTIQQIENCHLDQFMYIDNLFETSPKTVFLDTQYRMTNQIANMISALFYPHTIKNGRNVSSTYSLSWITYKPTQQWPVLQEENKEQPQIYNENERDIIVDLVKRIHKDAANKTIGIITPYLAQTKLLKKSIQQSEFIKIDTVDAFQGKECDVIIYSVTRTVGSYRFLADPRRLNVALSRAKDKIMIVGDKHYAEQNTLLSKILNYCTLRTYEFT